MKAFNPKNNNQMDLSAVQRAYRRHAPYYDVVFGLPFKPGRTMAVAEANRLAGRNILEVGVGTGLTLPNYADDRFVVGIDISHEMLLKARMRIARAGLQRKRMVLRMDAERLAFQEASFDIVMAMYVASVVPNPHRLLSEMRRVCKPDGHLFFVNHFARDKGFQATLERGLAPLSRFIGWRPDFTDEFLCAGNYVEIIAKREVEPLGLFTLVHCRNKA